MSTTEIFRTIDTLCALGSSTTEENYRFQIRGLSFHPLVADNCLRLRTLMDESGLPTPTIQVNDQHLDDDDLADPAQYAGMHWHLVLAKNDWALKFKAREAEDTLLFLSERGFKDWVKNLDPFTKINTLYPEFSGPTTIRVRGLQEGFGGPELWVLPLEAEGKQSESDLALPDGDAVRGLIHINADEIINIRPRVWSFNWGDLTGPLAGPLVRFSAITLASCLVQELKRFSKHIEVTIKGTKRVSVPLIGPADDDFSVLLPCLLETVKWVYEERPETRLQLIMDRLSIDIDANGSLLEGMKLYLALALQQARDSYGFVISERKDAYHKEMRELMKEMKTQADLYAAKVRELVSSLTRDVLGVLVLVGFSFIGKFDATNIATMLVSAQFALLCKVLAGYLAFSGILLLITSERDASMTYSEVKKWLEILKNYTSSQDAKDNVLAPVKRRRHFLWGMMIAIGIIYILLTISIFHLPSVITSLVAVQ